MSTAKIFLMTLLSFSSFVCYSTPAAIERGDISKINDLVDEILVNLRKTPWLLKKIDPMYIPDFEEHGVQITKIIFKGLSRVYRSGDCVIENDDQGVVVYAELAVKHVDISWNYKANALFLWRSGEAEGYVEDIKVKFAVTSINKKPKMKYFEVKEMRDYQVTRVTGVTFAWNWLLRRIVNILAHASRLKVIEIFETNGYNAMEQLLSNVTLPV